MINVHASLLLPIPSLRWSAALSFPKQMKETCGWWAGEKINNQRHILNCAHITAAP
ncbi:MAG: hypothetical protein IKE29_05335 [Paenibacillus sp.]|uniref:hypothetical protein n=1 Tax=Paenibacillus sp. TaxID=58172 RepID=UPI0025D1E35F|nr:hypothetical protein [Paenibacillus sp.]MBR2564029.1 hypothetical protein [Paenibacillus sp.]